MKTYPISDSLVDGKPGTHWVLAAVANGVVVALRYIEDVSPLSPDHIDGANALFFIQQWLDSSGAHSGDARKLKALGQLSIGQCSGREFVEACR